MRLSQKLTAERPEFLYDLSVRRHFIQEFWVFEFVILEDHG
jgi:hypothetical protein